MGRFAPLAAILLAVVACQGASQPVSKPSPSPTPHTAATAAVLEQADVPAGLTACPGSGSIDGYIAALGASNPSLAAATTQEWQAAKLEGAKEAAIALYAASPSSCAAELASTGSVKALASFVARFSDPGEADRAWEAGVFGFVPPPPGELSPGLLRGTSTGLGASSFTYDRPGARLASWHRSVFVALVLATNLDAAAFQAAAAAVDARLD